jgi:glycosyltransferase involved in cell wall biosynthesis
VKLRGPAGAVPTLAWVGRPAKVGGVDVSGLPEFLDAVRGMRRRPRVVLVGERLESAARTLKQLHVDCRIQTLRACPFDRVTDWISRFHCVVIGGTTDSAPWPLFDALYAGVPVVARPVGWATHILADGACGRLADDAAGMTAAIEEVLGSTGVWQARRALLRERVIDCNISAWVQANLQLAAELARGGVVQAA